VPNAPFIKEVLWHAKDCLGPAVCRDIFRNNNFKLGGLMNTIEITNKKNWIRHFKSEVKIIGRDNRGQK
jgi:hypothetical protein